MRIRILGAAAGGGYPQWNCNCDSCARVWRGAAAAQTQVSLAVTADNTHWFLLNAAPDLRAQILANDVLHPAAPNRHSPIAGAILTNGDVDAIAGLLDLRESQRLGVYATRAVLGVLEANSIFKVLNPDFVARRALTLDAPVELATRDGKTTGLRATAFSVPGKPALYLEGKDIASHLAERSENTVGLEIAEAATGKRFLFIPGCADIDAPLKARLDGAPLLFFDGTLWRDDEMIAAGLGTKTGKRMGHVSARDSIAALADCGIARRIFVHINNTNPLHRPDSTERAEATAAGWEIGRDGMELTL
ncbi:MAG TPA: pyrroloquinoline quinone biosynthesis protein PqqB [Stellaceae bacterium]|nr:pyrroloquinoline quinone biosynthesis protein PqqB [Stellaceae bacterium]